MLRILTSNQPVVWVFVPLTAAALFLLSVFLGHAQWVSWPAVIAISLAARLLHLIHAESGMRSRPDSITGWVWVLMATPFIGWAPDSSWWAFPCLIQGIRMAMDLRDADGRPGLFLFMGMWWSTAVVLESAAWPLLPAMAGALLTVRRWSVEEWLSGLIGILAPFLLAATVQWLILGEWDTVFYSGQPQGSLPAHALWVLFPVGLGWAIRQQSVVRATAQQRFARQLTQSSTVLGLICIALAYLAQPFAGWASPEVLVVFPGMLAFGAAWGFPWLMPPGYRVTAFMPFLFLLLSLFLLLVSSPLIA